MEWNVLESVSGGQTSAVGGYPPIVSSATGVSSPGADDVQGRELTDRQRQVLEVIRESMRTRGVAPSHTEIAEALGLASASSVEGHLRRLAAKGWISVLTGIERGIRLLREGVPILDAAHLPAVAAGTPTTVEECQNLPRLSDVDSVMGQFEARPDYFVRIEGDTLDKAGFSSGDIVAVRRQPEARDGDIVVARIGEEATLKRFRRIDENRIELQPVSSNPGHSAITFDPGTVDAEIVGIVVGAIVGTPRGAH